MLIESDPYQTRTAILEDGQLSELFIERHERLGVVGNIYRGRVNRVLPGMQAAFVDIGLERDAFLYVSEVMEARAAVQVAEAETSELDVAEPPATVADAEKLATRTAGAPEWPPIDHLLKPGQELVVQVLKDAMPNKGPRISTQITLPGRYLVFLPGVEHLGISRRIEDEAERERLRQLLGELRPRAGGLIARTAVEGCGGEEMAADLAYLTQLWKRIDQRAAESDPPALLHRDLDLARRVVRDSLSSDYVELWVEGDEAYREIRGFLADVQPPLVDLVKPWLGHERLLQHFGVEDEIAAALRSKVWLKSGGHIVIHQTEALVAIDINTGRYVGRHNLEDTVLRTNLEAVREIARQVRLRNLGGIIVIDLIDMSEPRHGEQVFAALLEELAKDRAKNKALPISDFGLVEITRKRSRPSLERIMTQSCPHCAGSGRIHSLTTVCLDLRRYILERSGRRPIDGITVKVHPDVAQELRTRQLAILQELELELDTEIELESEHRLHHQKFEVEVVRGTQQ